MDSHAHDAAAKAAGYCPTLCAMYTFGLGEHFNLGQGPTSSRFA